jgi:hypothetical protein
MGTIVTRLSNTGNLLINGTLDEITQTTISTNVNTLFSSLFDEVSNFQVDVARRDSANGTVQISGIFDEFTGAPVIDTTLTLWVDAAQSSSYNHPSATLADLSGNGTSFTLSNSPTFNSTDSGGTLRFLNTSSQFGTGAGTPVGINAYTKLIWFKLSGTADNNLLSSSVGGHFMFFGGTSKLYCGHTGWAGFPTTYPSTASFSVGVWYNVCLTFDTTNGMTLYINGVQDSTYTAQKTGVSGTGQCNLACFSPGGNLLNGIVAQAMIYNRVLTADEVVQNFNALRRRYNI